jgi:hypothetical protein
MVFLAPLTCYLIVSTQALYEVLGNGISVIVLYPFLLLVLVVCYLRSH